MILKLFKLKTKKNDFGCLPWVGSLLESHAVELLKKVHMKLSPLMFFFKKITCWIYQYSDIYIFFFFSLLLCFGLLRAYTILLKCQSYALEKQTLQHKRLLDPFSREGFHKLRSNCKCLDCTHHTYIHSLKHSPMEQIISHSFCSKQNSTIKKHFITVCFCPLLNKRKTCSIWMAAFSVVPSPCKQMLFL